MNERVHPGTRHRPPPAVTGFVGLSVLAVLLQSTGGFRVELLGADLVLAAGGYLTTRSLVEAARSQPDLRMPLVSWYRAQAKKRLPLLLATLVATAVLGQFVSPADGPAGPARQLGYSAVAGLAQLGNWYDLVLRARLLAPTGDWYADRPGEIDPFGALWLLGLLGQFVVLWPLLLACAWSTARRVRLRRGPAGPARAAEPDRGSARAWTGAGSGAASAPPPVAAPTVRGVLALVGTLTVASCLVVPVRVHAGAALSELALGSHARAVEWLLGATAAVATAAARARGDAPALTVRTAPRAVPEHGGRGWNLIGLTALAGLVAAAAAASRQPDAWLRGGGPAAVAGLAAVLLAALDRSRPLWPMGLRLPVELGKLAYPLLVLHLPVYAALRYVAPATRPYGLLLVGGVLAWMLGLVLQDGVVGRLRLRRWPISRAAPALASAVAGTLAAGLLLPGAVSGLTAGRGPSVLVLGGTFAGDVAAALRTHASGHYAVSDGSLPGCGLYPVPPPSPARGRSTADAQLPAPAPAYSDACLDWERQWRARGARAHPAVLVVDLSADAAARRFGTEVVSPCDPGYRRVYRDRLARAAAVWEEILPGGPVLLAGARRETGEADARSSRCFNALVGETIASHRAVLLLNIDGQLCPDSRCRTSGAHGPLYTDGVRLTPAGMADLAPSLERAVDEARTLARSTTPSG